jgi:uncharacterized protein (TIGR01440 family)
MLREMAGQAHTAVMELLEAARLQPGDLVVVGCSTSETLGQKIGSSSSEEVGRQLFEAIWLPLRERGIYLAAQCCEHLNRALIVERAAAQRYGLEIVNVLPAPKAGGSFATAAWAGFEHPAAVESVRAAAGMDIGDTLIGMHLRPVAVPVRLSVRKIGEANLVCARTRPKFVGGERAHYQPELL